MRGPGFTHPEHGSSAGVEGSSATKDRDDLFFWLYFLLASMLVVDCLLTKSPYSALHTGRVGLDAADTGFFVSPAYAVITSLLLLGLYSRKLLLDRRVMLLLGILLVSGIYTGGILSNPVTYAYNAVTLVLVSSVAITAARRRDASAGINWRAIALALTVLMIAGVLLAVALPGQYGRLAFEFSRQSRGEVTLWNVTGLFVLYPAVAVVVYRKFRSGIFVFVSMLMTLVLLSTASRAPVIITLLPFVLVLLFNRRLASKSVLVVIVLVCVLYFGDVIVQVFLGTSSFQGYADITSGRAALWAYYWSQFVREPLLGMGGSFLSRVGGYYGGATSEVGALQWFAENGLVFGFVLVMVVAQSVMTSVRLLARGAKTSDLDLMFALIVLSVLPDLLQGHARILTAEDLVFWFAVFFLSVRRAQLRELDSMSRDRDLAKWPGASFWRASRGVGGRQ